MAHTVSTTRRLFPRTLRGWALAFLGGLLLALLVLWWSAARTPGWYRPPAGDDPAVIDAASRFELRSFSNNVHQIRVLQNELNAFLAVRYGQYEGQKAPPISGPMVIFSPGAFTICARANKLPGIGSGVLALTFTAELLPPDPAAETASRVQIRLRSASLGSLPLPTSMVRQRLAPEILRLAPLIEQATLVSPEAGRRRSDIAPEEISALLGHIAREAPFAVPMKVGRYPVRIESLQLHRGELVLGLERPRR